MGRDRLALFVCLMMLAGYAWSGAIGQNPLVHPVSFGANSKRRSCSAHQAEFRRVLWSAYKNVRVRDLSEQVDGYGFVYRRATRGNFMLSDCAPLYAGQNREILGHIWGQDRSFMQELPLCGNTQRLEFLISFSNNRGQFRMLLY